MRLHIREVLDIEVPDFIALDTARCSRRESNRWTMRAAWHEDGNDLNRFLDSAVRKALLEKMRSRQEEPLLRGWYERPESNKDMP